MGLGRRKTSLALAGVAATTGLLLPYASLQLTPVPAFLPVFASATIVCEIVTSWLLAEQYLAQGDARLLWASGAYLFSGTVVVPHLLTFPGVFAPHGLLGAGQASATWLWVAWHSGFPACLLRAYTLPGDRRDPVPERRPSLLRLRVALLLLVPALAALATAGHGLLPTIIQGDDFSALTHRIGPVLVLLNAAALAATLRAPPGSALERYLPVAASI